MDRCHSWISRSLEDWIGTDATFCGVRRIGLAPIRLFPEREIAGLRRRRDFGKPFFMSDIVPVSVSAANSSPGNPDEIFRMLSEPSRRRVLLALAGGAALPAAGLTGTAGLRVDATLKHLTALCQAGMLSAALDPQDKRRMLYRLTPSVPVVRTATGTAIDFGVCLVVVSGTVQLAGVLSPTELTAKD